MDKKSGGFFKCVFSQYDHRGFVLNIDSFPGAVQIQGNTFKKNMAYIRDYVLEEVSTSLNYFDPVNIKYSSFENQMGQVFFKVCDLTTYRAEYLFQHMADSRDEFDDVSFVQNYETVSPLVIIANKGPIVIKDNTFEENIGTMGGAIHIMSPDF